MLPSITAAVRPPRALAVPFALGHPLGAPDAPERQREVLRALLALAGRAETPIVEEYRR